MRIQETEYDRRQTEARSEVFILCGVVTVTFRVLLLSVVTKCYSYSKIVLQLTVGPPGEYPINRH
jgi:nitrate reductase NapE component